MPGLEALAAEELTSLGARLTATLSRFDRRESLLLFQSADIRRVLHGRLAEDIFRVVLDTPTPHARNVPAAIARLLEKRALNTALFEHNALAPKRGGRSYRTVVRVAGRQPFRREDLEAAVVRALGALLPHWVRTRETASVEVWAHVISERTIAGVRLTPDEFAQRRYKRAHLPASLKPTVARALALWSGPRADDVVLDPMAGAGTILRERADAGPAKLIAGGDVDRVAIDAAQTNAGSHPHLALWDATRLPIRGESIDAMITNPPYGRQHEAVRGLDRLYRALLREAARALRPGGRLVVLTGEPAILMGAIPKQIRVLERHRLLLRGLPVTAFVAVKR
ncbi:MAG TPA: methyltransferase [Dehalococcoidia bacterium]|nr:methyltransferase [Dehalococcoidia bacterium]